MRTTCADSLPRSRLANALPDHRIQVLAYEGAESGKRLQPLPLDVISDTEIAEEIDAERQAQEDVTYC